MYDFNKCYKSFQNHCAEHRAKLLREKWINDFEDDVRYHDRNGTHLYINVSARGGPQNPPMKKRLFTARYVDDETVELNPLNDDMPFQIKANYWKNRVYPFRIDGIPKGHRRQFLRDYFVEEDAQRIENRTKGGVKKDYNTWVRDNSHVQVNIVDSNEILREQDLETQIKEQIEKLQVGNAQIQISNAKTEERSMIENLVHANKRAATQAAQVTAGKTVNTLVVDKLVPLLPAGVQEYAHTPLGRLVIANLALSVAQVYKESTMSRNAHEVAKVTQYMVDSAVYDLVDSVNIDQLISDFLSIDVVQGLLDSGNESQ